MKQAEEMLAQAAKMNAGAWVDHSKTVAQSAACIAEKCEMDIDKAYAMGLLHDIGRREGATAIRHIFDGYAYLKQQGFDEKAGTDIYTFLPNIKENTFK